MLPGGAVAAAFLLSLIPGWLFLRRTESSRRPRQLSTLQEVLELVAVGILTTGLAVSLGLLICPNLVLDRELPLNSAADVRWIIGLALATLIGSALFAELAAWGVRRSDKSPTAESAVSVWWAVMRPDRIPRGKLPYVAIALSDGSTLAGVLHEYTWSPDVAHRDVALRAPIKYTHEAKTIDTPYDFLIVPGLEVRHIALKYVPRGQRSR